MSRPITLAVFLATVAVVVPAAWHAPEADIPSDGPALRPLQQTMHAGGATIAVDLDRGVLMSGDRVEATLVGTADRARDVALDVRALQDNGMGGERVPNPPTELGHRRVVVHAAPGGGAPLKVAFKLRPHGMKKGVMEWVDIEVTAAGKRRDDVNFYAEGEDAIGARVGAAVWAGDTLGLVIEPPRKINGVVLVDLRVKNTTKHALDDISVRFGGPRLSYNAMSGLVFWSEEDDGIDAGELRVDSEGPLAPGAERVFTYAVTPTQAGAAKLPLLAEVDATSTINEAKHRYVHSGAMATVVADMPRGETAAPAVAGK